MENENNSKLDALAKCVLKQEKDIKKLKKRQPRKMTAMKFVGVAFDPEKYKAGEAEINEALSDGFEVLRDFETGGGIVIALGKWENKGEDGEKGMDQLKKYNCRYKNKVSSRDIPRYFFRISNVSTSKLLCTAFVCRTNSRS